ncbi:hypothetical protein M2281_002325 [Mesorhizobium soli]|nr:hypothetical protein [Mesorhizobium soli]
MMNGAKDSFMSKRAKRDNETTTRIAREIVDAEVVNREAKTQRLRQARLAREAAEPAMGSRKNKRNAPSKDSKEQSADQARRRPVNAVAGRRSK